MASLKDIEAWAEREALLEPGDSEAGQAAIEGPRVVRSGDVDREYPNPQGQRNWPEPMAKEAFHGLAGDIVRAIEPHTEADPVAVLVNTLVYLGNALGRTVHGVAEADWHGTNLFAVLTGETAKGRKGSSRGHIHELFSRIDPVWTHTRIMGGLS